MQKSLALLLLVAGLVLGGCASGLEVEDASDRGPAPHAPDPMGHVPVYQENNDQRR